MLSPTTFADELEREKAWQNTYDAMIRKAKAGHVTGGRVFGYTNHDVVGTDGRRLHLERWIINAEAAIVGDIFQRCAAGHGFRSIAKALNEAHAPAPVPRRGPSARLGPLLNPGGETLVQAIRERERQRDALLRDLAAPQRSRPATADAAQLRQQLRERLGEWRGLLRSQVPQSRQMIRKLCEIGSFSRRSRTPGSVGT